MLTSSDLLRPGRQACDAGDDDNVHRRLLELLAESASELLQAEDLAPALDSIFARIHGEVRLDVFFHYAFDEPGQALDLVAWGGVPPERMIPWRRVGISDSVCSTLARDRRVLIGEHIQQSEDPTHATARAMGLQAFYGTPLLHKNRLLGTLAFGRRCCPRFSDTEIRFLQTLSSYVTLADHRIGVDRELRLRLQERDRMLAERGAIEQRMLELTRASALGSIAATVAHELNQPLSAAANYMAAIRLSPSSDEHVRGLNAAAEQQLQRAGEIIRRIRRMVHHGDLVLEARPVTGVLEEAMRLVRDAAPRPLPPMTISVAPDARFARFDNVQIVQVLANLLRNASEAAQDLPGAAIWLRAEPLSDTEIVLKVIDNGPGIASDKRDRLFQPGLAQSAPDSGTGLGLGLAISRHLIEGHGGRIWAEETPGGGATFAFTLPVAAALDAARDVPLPA
ncbi:sensor histidine kinase [Sphingomonas azotifigens]|uniref:sensor histidine kinase n=1 Tax=Sphingomonas azotifigens TaxID=330920 RepID=UPI0009FE80B1|nr:GAF domain-containing sensor histidine kinase [Sphingomonas azotifigens]